MPNRVPSFKQLRAFEAAARSGSFKQAASELFVTQAAISHQIKALEETLGVRLFVRGAREVRPTKEAMVYARRLAAAFEMVASATAEIDRKRMSGNLRISVAPFYGNRWLLPRLPAFHADHPDLDVQVSLSFDLVDFKSSGIDAAVRYGLGTWPGLDSIPIHRDRIGPVCAPQLVAGLDLPLEPAAIAELTLAATTDWKADWPDWFAAAGTSLPARAEVAEFETRAFAFDAALSGNAAYLADIRMTASDVAAGNLVRLHPLTLERPQGIHLVFPASSVSDPRIEALGNWMIREAAAGDGGP
jgi:LysR family glycine cleavage system transcriptional activator